MRVGIERPTHMPGAALVERERRPPVDDPVEIVPRTGRKPRVEPLRNHPRREDRHGLACIREMGIERVAHRIFRPVAREVAMRYLAQSMDAGIGAPGAANADGFAAEALYRLFDGGLDGMLALLPLPARIGTAVILDVETVAWQA